MMNQNDKAVKNFQMQSLFQAAKAEEVKGRIAQLTADSERLWGTMTAAQALAHCAAGLEVALGDRVSPRGTFVQRMIGRLVKHLVLGNDTPMRHHSPTTKDLLVQDQRDFEIEQTRLFELIDRFAVGGPQGCSKHPHSFFGLLTPEQWAELAYKHLDHHLRQFGV